MAPAFICDPEWHRARKGLGVLAGSPLTYFSVSDAGARVLDAIETSTPLPANHGALTDRLLATGAIHPIPARHAAHSSLTVVIPAFIADITAHETLMTLVASLHGLSVIIIDDCSPFPIQMEAAVVVRHDENSGPAMARNSGLAHVTSEYVAFVDADMTVTVDQLLQLASYLEDKRVGLVAPRITTINDSTFIGEYESMHSPLDLGPLPALVRPVSRVSYVPSAVLVARTDTVNELGAFTADMRVGEDVDLVWRMVASGKWCRYVPSVECSHAPRQSLRALLRQRFSYGSSAAALDGRHRLSATPFRSHVLFAFPAAAILVGYLYLALFAIIPAIVFVFISLARTSIPTKTKILLSRKGLASSTALLARAVSRGWWPIFFLAAFFSVRLGAMFTFSVLVPPLWGLIRRLPHFTLRYFATRILDNAAYGLGVWFGAVRIRSIRCLMPVITVRRSNAR